MRPQIILNIRKVHHSAWEIFKRHHYLSQEMHRSCHVFVAFIDDQPVALCSVRNFPHPVRPLWSGSRLVVLPDYQGVGIGMALMDYVCSVFRGTGRGVVGSFGNPAVIGHMAKSPNWKLTRKPLIKEAPQGTARTSGHAGNRKTTCFEFVGPGNREDARLWGLA